MLFHCGSHILDLSRPLVMGIVNVTPDSFSDGGRYANTHHAIEHALLQAEQGADILDIGGESTRPNAQPVPLQEELQRVIPVIEGLRGRVNIPLSIDTYKPQVMQEAVAAGVSIINDVRALQEPGAVAVAAGSDAGVCLMHMRGTPQTMQNEPVYEDVVLEVRNFLHERAQVLRDAGVPATRIMIDPGFGFGKRTAHNLALLRELPRLCELGYPVLAGLSRKSVLGQVTGGNVEDRLPASLAAAVIATMKGAKILRVHDVKATMDALKVVQAVQQGIQG